MTALAPNQLDVTTGTLFARSVLNAAAEVETAESKLKDEIIAAARAGNTTRVIEIVMSWQCSPPAGILDRIRLDSCSKVEVAVSEDRRDGAQAPKPPPTE